MKITSQNTFKFISLFPPHTTTTQLSATQTHTHTQVSLNNYCVLTHLGEMYVCL